MTPGLFSGALHPERHDPDGACLGSAVVVAVVVVVAVAFLALLAAAAVAGAAGGFATAFAVSLAAGFGEAAEARAVLVGLYGGGAIGVLLFGRWFKRAR